MKLTLKMFGGFAPGLLPRPRVLDTARLDATRARHLAALVARLRAAAPTERHPDERGYELAIDDEAGCRTVRCADSTMTPAFEETMAFIEAHGD